jgi:hypothetical protein
MDGKSSSHGIFLAAEVTSLVQALRRNARSANNESADADR